MKTLFLKNKKNQHFFNYTEKKRLIWRYYLKNFSNTTLENKLYNLLYNTLTKQTWHWGSAVNRCVISNRSRAVYRIVKLSRIMFKTFVLRGLLVGFMKANW